MILSLLVPAVLATCPTPVSTTTWIRDVDAITEAAFAAEPGVDQSFEALYQSASCADGPIEATNLAALWLARGAWDVLSGHTTDETREFFATSRVIGGDAAWNTIFGPDVEAWFRAADLESSPTGTLLLFEPHEVLVIDGVVYDQVGPVSLLAGVHLVQWSLNGSWQGKWIRVDSGTSLRVGIAPVQEVSSEGERGASRRFIRIVPLAGAGAGAAVAILGLSRVIGAGRDYEEASATVVDPPTAQDWLAAKANLRGAVSTGRTGAAMAVGGTAVAVGLGTIGLVVRF